MISVSIFSVSLIGIIFLLSFSLWEKSRGRKLWAEKRASLDRRTESLHIQIKKSAPSLNAGMFLQAYHRAIHSIALLILSLARMIERHMLKTLEKARGKREIVKNGRASDFLTRVREHKQSLEKPDKDA